MRRLALLLVVALLLLTVSFYFRGFTWTARFPYDWQYYQQFSVTSPTKVVVVTLPTASLVSEGKLRPDCSDLRFTTDANISTVLPFAIDRYYFGHEVTYWRYGTVYVSNQSGELNIFVRRGFYRLCYRFPSMYRDYRGITLKLYDVNTGEEIWSKSYYCGYCTIPGWIACSGAPLVQGHLYRLEWSAYDRDQFLERLPDTVDLNDLYLTGTFFGFFYAAPYAGVSSQRTYGGLFFVPLYDKNLPYCAVNDELNFFVRTDGYTGLLRAWYGAQGDVNSMLVVGLHGVADVYDFPLSVSQPNFVSSNCRSGSWGCGGDYYCDRTYTTTVGPFTVTTRYSGVGTEDTRGYYCHGTRFWWYDPGYCGHPLANRLVWVYGWYCASCYPRGYPSVYSNVTISFPSTPYFYELNLGPAYFRQGRIIGSWGDAYMYLYVFDYWNLNPTSILTAETNFYVYCSQAHGCAFPYHTGTYTNDLVVHGREISHAFTTPLYLSARFSGSFASCFSAGIWPSVTTSTFDLYYLYPSDISLATPYSGEQVYSGEPYWVFSGPLEVYWGVNATYSVDGNFAYAQFEVEPFGTFDGNSVTVSWPDPGTYRVTPIVYNEYNTPFWQDYYVTVKPRELRLSYDVLDHPYINKPFRISLVVTDNLGDPVDVNVTSPFCTPCSLTDGNTTCVVTCEVNCYGPVPIDFNLDAYDDVHYVDATVTATVDVDRWPTEFRDVSVFRLLDFNNFMIQGRLWDTLNDVGVEDAPLDVNIYLAPCPGRAVLFVGHFPGITTLDGNFRVFVGSDYSGAYCVRLHYPGDALRAPATMDVELSFENAPALSLPPEVNYPELNVSPPVSASSEVITPVSAVPTTYRIPSEAAPSWLLLAVASALVLLLFGISRVLPLLYK